MSSSASRAPGVFGSKAWPDRTFLSLCDRRHALRHCVYCTRLILTRIIVCSKSFYLFLSEFDIPELWLQLTHLSLKYQAVDLPYTVFHTGTLDGFKGAVNRWLLP